MRGEGEGRWASPAWRAVAAQLSWTTADGCRALPHDGCAGRSGKARACQLCITMNLKGRLGVWRHPSLALLGSPVGPRGARIPVRQCLSRFHNLKSPTPVAVGGRGMPVGGALLPFYRGRRRVRVACGRLAYSVRPVTWHSPGVPSPRGAARPRRGPSGQGQDSATLMLGPPSPRQLYSAPSTFT